MRAADVTFPSKVQTAGLCARRPAALGFAMDLSPFAARLSVLATDPKQAAALLSEPRPAAFT
ncbi:hypothetical protein CLM62_10415 [Streptomyces sp. SA15]|uniref:hypothetical protein n=1 Tax=Streptomyces sp. SA15 TaxID=934019 RepID=UPI000BB0C13E|nr:hypothetical protein [Streptomyces sp. SA15]PAZ16081.1 hypothetical protein CLM62_10415 [Streptomyces sp. SA15]